MTCKNEQTAEKEQEDYAEHCGEKKGRERERETAQPGKKVQYVERQLAHVAHSPACVRRSTQKASCARARVRVYIYI